MQDLLLYGALFLALLGESTLIVGTFVPGINALIAATLLASTGRLDIIPVFIAGWLGVFIGDNVGYLIGRYGLHRIPVARRWLDKAKPDIERFLNKYERWLVFYQFVGFARAPLPVFFGSIHFSFRSWLWLVARSSTLLISILMLISYYLGRWIGEELSIKLVIGLQVLFGVIVVVLIAKAVYKRYKNGSSTD